LILLDTSALFAALIASERQHQQSRSALEHEDPPFILSPLVLCELDYLLRTGTDVKTELGFLAEVAEHRYDLAPLEPSDVAAAHDVIEQYSDLGIGLTDASIVVLSDRFDTNRVFTLDERHFRALRTVAGRPFTLLPADA
jgi:hypothetical protein